MDDQLEIFAPTITNDLAPITVTALPVTTDSGGDSLPEVVVTASRIPLYFLIGIAAVLFLAPKQSRKRRRK